MADPVHLEKLCQGPKLWNAWRKENPELAPDLSDARLTLSQRQFGPSNGGPIDLSNADLSGGALRYATLTGANFAQATLIAADLVHSRLDGVNFTAADLTDGQFDHANLAGARLDGAILIGASFADARNLTQAQIDSAHGDASTVLPATLLAPERWFPRVDDDIVRQYSVPERRKIVDLYDVLGVERSAKPDEIRASFRNLVKKFHPDLNPDDRAAQDSFKTVSTAYRVLSDPDKRSRYDRGEIGGDGEIDPEFAAKKQFRKYAFRFYAAASMSLVFAIGVLAVVWHSVLSDDVSDRGRIEIAVATPPKTMERLDSTAWPDSSLRQDAAPAQTPSAKSEVKSGASQNSHQFQVEAPAPAALDQAIAVPERGYRSIAQSGVELENKSKAEQSGSGTPAAAANDALDVLPGNEKSAPQTATAQSAKNTGSASVQPVMPQPLEGKHEASKTTEQLAGLTHLSDGRLAESGQEEVSKNTAAGLAPDPPASPAKVASGNDGEGRPTPSADLGGTARPLGQDHSEIEARPAQADAAGTNAPAQDAAQSVAYGEPDREASDVARGALGRFLLRSAQGGPGARDAISEMFRSRAIKNALGEDRSQATASMEPLSPRDKTGDQEEIWDIYTHSIPDQDGRQDRQWPAGLTTQTGAPAMPVRSQQVMARKLEQQSAAARAPAAQQRASNVPDLASPPEKRARGQAVSEILAGGL